MILTKPEIPEEISFWQACKYNNLDGADICDTDWDWGIYLGFPENADSLEECEDGYDRFCLMLALNLKCKNLRQNWYTPCNVCGFIEAHRQTFEDFFNRKNREGYRPSDYEGPLKADEDDGYYEAFMQPLESMLAGNYCDEDYEELVKMILAEE